MSDEGELIAALQQASAFSDEGDWEEAFRVLREQEPEHADDATLLCMLGVAARELGHEGHAYEYFRRCAATEPSDPLVLVTAGSALAAFDDAGAEPLLRLAALTAPALPMTRLHYGAYLAREGLFVEALTELEAARELDADDVEIRAQLGVAYLRAGRLDDGLAELDEAEARGGEDGALRVLHGVALWQAGRQDEAAEELYHLSLAMADDGELQVAAALAAAAQGWDAEAWNALARAEGAALPAPSTLLAEAEEAVGEGPDAAAALLSDEVAASLLHERLLER